MKKLLALLLAFLLPLSAMAEWNDENNIVVQLHGVSFFFTPIEGLCVTRMTSPMMLRRNGIDADGMQAWMQENDVYAIMTDVEESCQFVIQASPAWEDATDLDDLTEYGEMAECEYLASDMEAYGYQVAEIEMYTVPGGHKFIWALATYTLEDGSEQQYAQYLTRRGGYNIIIEVPPLDGVLTQEQLALGDSLADSMWIMKDAVSLDATEY